MNNAGTSLFAATEEASDEQIRDCSMRTTLAWFECCEPPLPLLRKQGSGHILGVSSGLGITAMPLIGFYCATKWAVEAMHEALAAEVKAFGIRVTLVEPGRLRNRIRQVRKIADALGPYADFRKQFLTRLADRGTRRSRSNCRSHPEARGHGGSAAAIGAGRLDSAEGARRVCGSAGTWEAWEDVSNAAMGEPRKTTAAWIEELVHGTPDQA